MLSKSYVKSRDISKVTFSLASTELPEGISAKTVHLVGDFNNWDASAMEMSYSKKHKAYRATVELAPGQSYQFRYLINSQLWCNDWEADAYVPGTHGQDNCVVVTPAGAA